MRRNALMFESAPILAGAMLALFWSAFASPIHHPLWEWLVLTPITWLSLYAAFPAFLVSGVGWMMSGRGLSGGLIMIGRGALTALSILGSFESGLTPVVGAFLLSVSLAIASVLALMYSTRPRGILV